MNPNPRARRGRPALSTALAMAAFSGCATRSSTVRPLPGPDLPKVSAVAPAIDAGSAGPAGPPRRRPPVAGGPGPPPAASTGRAAAPAAGVEDDPGPSTAAADPPTIPESGPPRPIDLATALRLADGRNPTIGEARVLILGALAERRAARALLLPSLNAGTNYRDHTGPLQRSGGTILPLTEQSLYVGGGARALAAESVAIPAVNVSGPLTDAIFEPMAARQRVIAARLDASDVANKVLLDVATLYVDLVGAGAILEARRETAGEADRVADSVAAFAATGQGRASDAERAEADRRLFRAEVQRAEERAAVASALLAERLNLDPSARLRPPAGPLEPIELIDPETPPEELIRSAAARRPDLAAREAMVTEAGYRVGQERARPLLPTIWLGFSGGAFGGGSNLTATPLGSFAGRTDFDVRAYWTVLNLGAGNASLVGRRRAEAGRAVADRSIVLNRVRAEVAAARAESLALRAQVATARLGLRTAEDGYRQDQTRLRETLALPIEALDSLRLLSEARVTLIRAITRANRAQFALFVSLGTPPPPPTGGD